MAAQSIAKLFDFTGKGAIVTGGAMGNGQGMAFRLAEAGAAVTIADINLEAARQTAEQIKARRGKAQAIRADVRLPSDAASVAQAAVDTFGSLDILVNNAGIYPVSSVLDTSEEFWDKVIDTNLKSTFFFSQAAARQMVKAGHGGKIINIASMQAFHPIAGNSAYGATKGGIVSLTYGLAIELAPHRIQVNCIAPGGIATPGIAATFGLARSDQGATKGSAATTTQSKKTAPPLGSVGEPDDIARVVLFLASPASDFMTGSIVLADNGLMLARFQISGLS